MNDESPTEILNATYRTLCKHGYADLTLQDIAAESEMSKASIHYYYESKNELFVVFLEFLYDRYTTLIDSTDSVCSREHLRSLLRMFLTDEEGRSEKEFRTAMLEMKAQAPYDDEIQTRLVEFDEYLFKRIREIISTGVDAGEFTESVAPERIAEILTTIITGSHTRQVAIDHSVDRLYETITTNVETQLLTSAVAEEAQ
ncbi:TetR/AcrR family transcriptional regulator (plasmid) [Natrinema zhouii]|uniref:TetR/AcrR family transcriptional regulator n=1 Tax=Natrinema zhouii TaxID=1710539 RepID=UPI001CFF6192|nr:TetR/AcrR family transcriptional regulator [Natrinema zhouii]UHQ98671.1 TetR/AcrR family transcriptional regulator [Natrinema zhouii]